MSSLPPKLQFEQVANDLIYELLSYIPIKDIIRSRRVCKRFQDATHQRTVWSKAYRNSKLLIPEGPTSTQTAQELEDLLVRAAKIQRKWTTQPEARPASRKFLDGLPVYEYDVAMISGRYLMVGTLKEITWYDIDQDEGERLGLPIATYKVRGTMSVGMQLLSVQANANNEGLDTVYVAFVVNHSLKVLKVSLPPCTASIEMAAEFPQFNYFPVGLVLGNDFLLAIKEFHSDQDCMDLFHIPTKRKYLVPMHGRVHNLSDLNYVNYIIAPTHLVMIFPITHQGESEVELFRLPTASPAPPSVSRLSLSHRAVYPGAIWKAVSVFESPPPILKSSDIKIGILATCYEEYNRQGTKGKTSLQYFDINISSLETVELLRRSSSVMHDLKPQTTDIFATSSSTACLAFTQTLTMHEPILMMHDVQRDLGTTEGNIVANRLMPLTGKEGMTLVAFDGFHGRICFNVQGSQNPRIDVWSMT